MFPFTRQHNRFAPISWHGKCLLYKKNTSTVFFMLEQPLIHPDCTVYVCTFIIQCLANLITCYDFENEGGMNGNRYKHRRTTEWKKHESTFFKINVCECVSNISADGSWIRIFIRSQENIIHLINIPSVFAQTAYKTHHNYSYFQAFCSPVMTPCDPQSFTNVPWS